MLNTIDKLHISYNGIFDNNKPMTQSEQMYYLLSKLNLIIEHFNLLETNTNKSITDFNEKVNYYLAQGLIKEIKNNIQSLIDDGTIKNIIDEGLFNEIRSDINSLDQRANDLYNTIIENEELCNNSLTEINKKLLLLNTEFTEFKNSVISEIQTINTELANKENRIKVMENIKIVSSVNDLRSALLEGGQIYITEGVYDIDTALLYKSHTKVNCIGKVVLRNKNLDREILLRPYLNGSEGGYEGVVNVEFNDLIFDGRNNGTAYGLFATAHCDKITLNRCTFKDVVGSWHMVEINSSSNIEFNNCEFNGYNVGVASSKGATELLQFDYSGEFAQYPFECKFDNTRCKNIHFNKCEFKNAETSLYACMGSHSYAQGCMPINVNFIQCTFENIDNVIYAKCYKYLNVIDCVFLNVASALLIDNTSSENCEFKATGNYYNGYKRYKVVERFNNTEEGRFIFHVNSNDFLKFAIIEGNTVYDAYSHGIGITLSHSNVSDNLVYSSGKHGIYFYGFDYINVNNNTAIGNGTLSNYSGKDGYFASGLVGPAKCGNSRARNNLGTWTTDGQSYTNLIMENE